MKKRYNLLLVLVLIVTALIFFIMYLDSSENGNLKRKEILTIDLKDRTEMLVFFEEYRVNEEEIDSQNEFWGGLEIKNGKRLESFTARNFTNEPVIWNTDKIDCEENKKCEPVEVLYGFSNTDVKDIEVGLNGVFYNPKLLKTSIDKYAWYIIVSKINTLDSIKVKNQSNKIINVYQSDKAK